MRRQAGDRKHRDCQMSEDRTHSLDHIQIDFALRHALSFAAKRRRTGAMLWQETGNHRSDAGGPDRALVTSPLGDARHADQV
jgi:hypothetical protein